MTRNQRRKAKRFAKSRAETYAAANAAYGSQEPGVELSKLTARHHRRVETHCALWGFDILPA